MFACQDDEEEWEDLESSDSGSVEDMQCGDMETTDTLPAQVSTRDRPDSNVILSVCCIEQCQ